MARKTSALLSPGPPHGSANLDSHPDLAASPRRRHAAITAGGYLSKRHRHTGTLDGSVPKDEPLYKADHSYKLRWAACPGPNETS